MMHVFISVLQRYMRHLCISTWLLTYYPDTKMIHYRTHNVPQLFQRYSRDVAMTNKLKNRHTSNTYFQFLLINTFI